MGESNLMITGSQLAALSNDQVAFDKALEECLVFAKISPHQKLQIVRGLRNGGRRAVAFLGDGVNDALAIHEADVGISVDSGTEIAKEAADVILLEKSLDVIAHGVLQGRITCVPSFFVSLSLTDWYYWDHRFMNTIKYVKMATSSNFGNVFSIVGKSSLLQSLCGNGTDTRWQL